MKILILIIIFLCSIFHARTQNCGKEQADAINQLVLTKSYILNQGNENEFTSKEDAKIDASMYLYFDENKNLRKLISWSNYPESSSIIIAYYNEVGLLMSILFNDSQPEGYSYQGTAYRTNCDQDDLNMVNFDYKLQESFGIDFSNTHTLGHSQLFPSTIGYWPLSKYVCIDSLRNLIGIQQQQLSKDCKKVHFEIPQKERITYINANSVSLRERPSPASKIIKLIDAGESIKVIEVLQEETMKNLGTHNWYKVGINNTVGYVYGAFLEPVEQEIK